MSAENKNGFIATSEKAAYVTGGVLFLLGAPGLGLTIALAGLGLHMVHKKN